MDGAKDAMNGDAANGKQRRSNANGYDQRAKGPRSSSRNSNYEEQDGRGQYDRRGPQQYKQQPRRENTPPSASPPSGGPARANGTGKQPPIGTERGEGKVAEAVRIQSFIAPPQKPLPADLRAKVEQVQNVLHTNAPDATEIIAVLNENHGDAQKTISHFLETQKAGGAAVWSEVVKRVSHSEPAKAAQPKMQQPPLQQQVRAGPPAQVAHPHAPHPAAAQHAAPGQHAHAVHAQPQYQQPVAHHPVHVQPPAQPEPESEPEPEPVVPTKRPEEVANDLNNALTIRVAQIQEQTRRLTEIQQQLVHATTQGDAEMSRLKEEKQQLLDNATELQERLRVINMRLSHLDIEIDNQEKDKAEKIHALNEQFRSAEAALMSGLGVGAGPLPVAKPQPTSQLHALQQVVPHIALQHPGQIGQRRY